MERTSPALIGACSSSSLRLKPAQIRNSSLNYFGKSFYFLGRIPGCAETIAILFSREPPEKLTQPFGVRARNVFGNVLHLRARDIVGDVNRSGKKADGYSRRSPHILVWPVTAKKTSSASPRKVRRNGCPARRFPRLFALRQYGTTRLVIVRS